MTFRLRLALLPVSILALACGNGSEMAAGDTAPIDDVRSRYMSAYNAGDAAALAALFADDAISMPDHHAPVEGRAAIESYFRDMFTQYSGNLTVTPGETEVTGDIAHEHGTFSVTLTPKAGGSGMTEDGKYLVILKRSGDGVWLLHHNIGNANTEHAPPPADQGGESA